MANSIGGYTAHRIVRGQVDPLGLEAQAETRPGVSGYDLIEVGYRGQPFELVTFRDYDSESDLNTGHATAKAQQGRVVTVVDVHGRSWGNILVVRVTEPERSKFAGAAGGETAGVWGLTLRFTCMAV